MSDYSVGKTTFLKSKTISLATPNDQVLFVSLGTAEMEPVMAVSNRRNLMRYNIKTISETEVREFYNCNSGMCIRLLTKLWKQSSMEMLIYYIKQKLGIWKNVFVDEAPVQQNQVLMVVHQVI